MEECHPSQSTRDSLDSAAEPSTPASPSISITSSPPLDSKEPATAESNPPPEVAPIVATEVASKAIAFLSTAPPEQLIAISIGGAAVLYFVLGQLGILVVGVVAGVVGHATLSLKDLNKDGSELQQWLEARKKDGTAVAEEEEYAVAAKVCLPT